MAKKPKGYKNPNKAIMDKMMKKHMKGNAPANFGGGEMGTGEMTPSKTKKRKKKAKKRK